MKNRYLWLAVLPYVVNCHYDNCVVEHGKEPVGVFQSRVVSEDLADALNYFHQYPYGPYGRVDPSPQSGSWKDSKKADWEGQYPPQMFGIGGDNKPPKKIVTDRQACGQDNCGKESQ